VAQSGDRFPVLAHLSWSRRAQRPPRHHLGTSAIPIPPPEIFDPTGPVLLDAQTEGERAFSERLAARYGVPVEDIVLTAGVSEGIFLSGAALLHPGDAVLVEAPGYQSLTRVPAALGASVIPLERALDGSLDGDLAVDSIARAASGARWAGKRLAAVYLSDLHNPTGARLDDATIDLVVGACRREGATLVLDEVYRDSDSSRPVGTAHVRHRDVVTLSSLTKSYGLGGLRLGWLFAPDAIAAAARRAQNYLSVLPAAPSIGLGIRVLEVADRILEWADPMLRTNRDVLTRVLAAEPGGFVLPDTGIEGTIAFPYRPSGPDTRAETLAWVETHEVCVVPGAFFGAPSGVRIGLGKEPKAFEAALTEWQRAVVQPARA